MNCVVFETYILFDVTLQVLSHSRLNQTLCKQSTVERWLERVVVARVAVCLEMSGHCVEDNVETILLCGRASRCILCFLRDKQFQALQFVNL